MPPKKDRRKKGGGEGAGGDSRNVKAQGDEPKISTAAAAAASTAPPPKTMEKQASTTKEAVSDLNYRFSKMGISTGLAVMPEKQGPGRVGTPMTVTTNVYPIQLPQVAVYRYDIEIIGTTAKGKEVELTKRSRDDFTQIERKKLCSKIWARVASYPMFNGWKVYYDGQKQLYSLKMLKVEEGGHTFTFNAVTDKLDLGDGIKSAMFKIQAVTEDFQLSLADLSVINRNLDERDQSLLQFVNIATSQYAVANPKEHVTFPKGQSYLMEPWNYGFQDNTDLPEGKYIAIGAHKSAMAIEGPQGPNHRRAAVAVDTAKTAFHTVMPVTDKVLAVVPNFNFNGAPPLPILRKLSQQLKGVMVEMKIGAKRMCVFKIHSVSPSSAHDRFFEVDGRQISVEQHFRNKYQITLKYPKAPLLLCRRGAREDSLFPMELCDVVDNQRVQQGQQTPTQLKGMRNTCIVPPAKRMQQNVQNANALMLSSAKNSWLAGANIRVDSNPMQVNARILNAPMVGYAGNTVQVDNVRMWIIGNNRFIEPKRLDNWAMFLLTVGQRDRMGLGDLQKFIAMLMDAGQRRGMEISQPVLKEQLNADERSIQKIFMDARKKRCNFIFFVQSDFSELHPMIKVLEREHQIITQDMKISVASNAVFKRQNQTMENVVCKTNIKLGGLNHSIAVPQGKWMNPLRLFMGIAMSHPGPGARSGGIPSVIGYSANTRQQCGFVGDFGFQQIGRTDNLDVLEVFVKNIVADFKVSRGGKAPLDAVIYRSGVSEGEYKTVLQYEVPLIRKAFANNGCPPNMKLVLFIVSKMHNVRLFPSNVNPRDRPMEQNLKPGTVVDVGVVHPEFPEFYLNSHKALQGSAKVPRYTVVVNDHGFNMDQLQEITFQLCFAHEIVTLSTSTPTPLYVATRYAERGRIMVVQKCLNDEGSTDTVSVQEANDSLPYHGTPISQVRLNA